MLWPVGVLVDEKRRIRMCFLYSSTQGFAMPEEHDPRESIRDVHHDGALLDLDTLIPGTLLSVFYFGRLTVGL